ncbi:hypothetical protein PS631_01626 [Pseudomonas fluorescens]|uniref:Uncharacterized protein n=1 Tax=Pseudomonas fluorescens TaxID=294 RepID=A0A5E6RGY6_PSEFL|nr:hypothetical protein PS631_01626 [Pseudomonas fluorescens]
MDGRQALRPRMGRTARSSRELCRSEGTPERSAGAVCGSEPFFGYFFGAFAKKVTRRKGERRPHCHNRKWISSQNKQQTTNHRSNRHNPNPPPRPLHHPDRQQPLDIAQQPCRVIQTKNPTQSQPGNPRITPKPPIPIPPSLGQKLPKPHITGNQHSPTPTKRIDPHAYQRPDPSAIYRHPIPRSQLLHPASPAHQHLSARHMHLSEPSPLPHHRPRSAPFTTGEAATDNPARPIQQHFTRTQQHPPSFDIHCTVSVQQHLTTSGHRHPSTLPGSRGKVTPPARCGMAQQQRATANRQTHPKQRQHPPSTHINLGPP